MAAPQADPPEASAPSTTSRSGVKSAVRTVELLEFLAARQDRPTSIREICEALGMPRSSAHALLRTLMAQGWVRADGSGTLYGIGIRALLVGTSYLDSDPYLPMITPFLDELRHDLDETFHLGRLDDGDVVYLATRESRQYQRVTNRVGRRLPAHATALGKALLADRFGAERDAHLPDVLRSVTPKTLTDRAGLQESLENALVRGYATDDEENTVGTRCFAVALRYTRPAQDAISASVPIARLTPAREREIVEALCAVGDKVTRVLRPVANGDKWFSA
ncbi:IclR family transcriptional regulator [Mycolicibacterium sediminis]|uniref:Glycerol operon regulatory protein n=1 Tax=Mycolicibacterium sediminis TaxID=1286180 RepID=A0A7I7QJB4_9MYCO|nr:IclR family transcriptional regulator [Mycolicibacterium sediminis]BBY26220.1 IclR family transcriptional regulator [Mycolicibacterium sediminis]